MTSIKFGDQNSNIPSFTENSDKVLNTLFQGTDPNQTYADLGTIGQDTYGMTEKPASSDKGKLMAGASAVAMLFTLLTKRGRNGFRKLGTGIKNKILGAKFNLNKQTKKIQK